MSSLARAVHVTDEAVSQWETGARNRRSMLAPPEPGAKAMPEMIATALNLTANELMAFQGMLSAAGSPLGLSPRRRWSHNFDQPGLPVWVWVRTPSPAPAVTVNAWWSEPLQGTITGPCDERGVIALIPTSTNNPPLEVAASEAVWVDFGHGVIPSTVLNKLGIPHVDPRETLTAVGIGSQQPGRDETDASGTNGVLGWAQSVATQMGIRWAIISPHIGIMWPRGRPYGLDELVHLSDSSVPAPTDPSQPPAVWAVTPAGLRAVRDSRGLSRADVVQVLNTLDPRSPVTPRTLELLETGSGRPPTPGLISRLDTAYQADGRVGVERTYDSLARPRPTHVIQFPPYYTGPVWVSAISPHRTAGTPIGVVDLRWGLWRRVQTVTSGLVLTTRKSSTETGALEAEGPPGWRIVAGIGEAADVVDINHGWHPVNLKAGVQLLADGLSAVRRAQRR